MIVSWVWDGFFGGNWVDFELFFYLILLILCLNYQMLKWVGVADGDSWVVMGWWRLMLDIMVNVGSILLLLLDEESIKGA